jgi:ATP-dependent Clp protease ATP-binding subunit ClpX
MKKKLKLPKHNLKINEKLFLKLLEETQEFTYQQKLKILENISKMKQWQFNDLMDILNSKKKNETSKSVSSYSLKSLKSYLDSHVISQEDAKEKLSLAFYEHLIIRKEENDNYLKPNILLIGPSGVGKTYMASLLANYTKRPFVIANAANMVSAGYVGTRLDDILTRLYLKADKDLQKAQDGIILIDEFDKMTDGRSHDSVGGEELQQEFLKLIEGGKHICKSDLRKDASKMEISTDNILFIFSGAFVKINEIVKRRHLKSSIGFNSDIQKSVKNEILPEDIIKYGIIPELVGRIQTIASLEPLTEKDLFKILKNKNNPYLNSLKKFFKYHKSEITFTDGALKYISQEALKLNLGARGLKSIIDRVTQRVKFDMVLNGSKEIKITKNFVGSILK